MLPFPKLPVYLLPRPELLVNLLPGPELRGDLRLGPELPGPKLPGELQPDLEHLPSPPTSPAAEEPCSPPRKMPRKHAPAFTPDAASASASAGWAPDRYNLLPALQAKMKRDPEGYEEELRQFHCHLKSSVFLFHQQAALSTTSASSSSRAKSQAALDACPARMSSSEEKVEVSAGHGSEKVKESARIQKKARLMKASAAGEGSSASPAVPINTPPLPVRFPPYPKSGTARDVVKWSVACRKFRKQRAKDPRLNLPTVRKPKDPETTKAVQNPKDKKIVIDAARSIVSISSIGHDGMKIQQCSGIILCRHEGKVIVATSSIVVCKMGRLLDPLPRVSICLSDAHRTTLEGELVFFDYHYDLALLAIEVPFPVKVADSGSCPQYGQEIYALFRGEESDLMVRHGIVKYHGESGYLGRDYYFFLNCEIPEEATGGSVVDLTGKTIGMTLRLSPHPHPAVISITTMEICIAMALQFGRIARPMHGLSLRSISFLDVQLLDELSSCYDIDTGFIVDEVSHGSVAERLGIEYGDVICSFGHLQTSTLPELEDHLLDFGLKFLKHRESIFELKVRVCSLLRRSGRSISLPITFCTKKVRYAQMGQ